MDRHRLRRSALFSVAQVILSGGTLFFFYRYLIHAIGVTALGVWSVVLASTSLGRFTDLGLGGGVSRFVARAGATENRLQAARYVETALIVSATVTGLLTALSLPILRPLLAIIITRESLGTAVAMLPYALLSYWILGLTNVFHGGLDGILRVDLRNGIMIASSVLQVALGVPLVHWTGVMGLAYMQIAQAAIILIVSWVALRRGLPSLSVIPRKWDYSIARELLGFGWKLQAGALTGLLFEPVTKGLLARMGGLASAGYYEMATRMVLQLRAILVNANQVLVPAIADMQHRDPARSRFLYNESYRVVAFLVPPVLGGTLVSLPAVSELWIGRYEPQFVTFAALVAVGWFLNALSAPSYFSALGAGRVHWNLLGHIVLALLNVVAGYGLGLVYGGTGVVVGAMLSLVAGSAVIIVNNHREEGESFRSLLPRGIALLATASALGTGLGLLAYHLVHRGQGVYVGLLVGAGVWLACIAWPVWHHPVRERLSAPLIGLLPSNRLATSSASLRRRLTAWIRGE